jgi:hypothetical protein
MIPPEYLNQIVTGDARELSKRIPDESIDLIFTDPVYDRIKDYEWLAGIAKRVLKPDSACLVYCAIGKIPEVHAALLRGGLSYRWRLITRTVYSNEFHGRLIVGTQECLWYEKGDSRLFQSIFDLEMATMSGRGDYKINGKNWGKHQGIAIRYIETFCRPSGITLDLFSGSGTVPAVCKMLGRDYVAFEIDPDMAELARERVLNTQPPLFVPEPEQLELT